VTRSKTSDSQLDAFADRVMAAIARVASPSPTRSFVEAIRTGSGRDAVAALGVAWHLATQRDWPVAPRVRARSLALVLAVASILATGSMVAASAARVIVPPVDRTKILDLRGSIIVESGPDHVAPTGSSRPHLAPVTVPVPGVVSLAISKKVPISTGGQTPASGTRHSAPAGTTSTHDRDSDQADAGTPADHSDASDGTQSGADDAGSGMASGRGSDVGRAGGDASQAAVAGGTPSD